jgi:hypothetical protein
MKLKSGVDDAEFMVIKGSGLVVEYGGVPMTDQKPATPAAMNPASAGGVMIGKRYVDEAGTVELLCVKAGKGSLSIGGVALQLKEAKPLPSSD